MDRANDSLAFLQLVLVLNAVLLAAMAFCLHKLWVRVKVLEGKGAEATLGRLAAPQARAAAPRGREVEKSFSTGCNSPRLIAVITGAVAAYLEDEKLERHGISSITELTQQKPDN